MPPRPHAPRNDRRWQTSLAAVLAAFALGVASCVAPTLPVPPPAQPEVLAPDASGTVVLRGKAQSATPGADVGVTNFTLRQSCPPRTWCRYADLQLVRSDGSWELHVDGKKKDLLFVYQLSGFDRSTEVEIVVP